jgi:PAS domain S-box-containing protein
MRVSPTRAAFAGDDSLFRALLESAPDAMVIVDNGGTIVLVNSQTERLFGYPRQELLGQPVEMLVPYRFQARHPEHRRNYFGAPRVREMGAGLDLYGRRRNGEEFPVEISLSPLQTGSDVLVSSSIRDVTDRKRVERALQQKNVELEQASRAKDRFLASMSHELRTPLNAIIGFTGTLLMRLPGPLTPDQAHQLETVRTSARHLLSLINDLLDLARIQSGKVEVNSEPVVCQRVVEEVATTLRPLAEAKGLTFDVTLPARDVIARTDRRALSQILLNLTNTRSSSPNGEACASRWSRPSTPDLRSRFTSSTPGSASVPRISPCCSRRSPRSGRRRATPTAPGWGSISAGCSPISSVDRSAWPANSDAAARSPCRCPGRDMGCRILVIEDNQANLELMTYPLAAFGHTTIAARDGEAGVAAARQALPHLILCDIALPVLDGYGVARRLKAEPGLAAVPLIAVTASAMAGDRDKIIATGFDGYISKPITPETFVADVECHLPRH